MGAVSLKLESAYRSQQMTAQIASTVPTLKNALKQMEKSGVNAKIADFEKVFEDLDVNVESMTGALDTVVGQSAGDANAVNNLL